MYMFMCAFSILRCGDEVVVPGIGCGFSCGEVSDISAVDYSGYIHLYQWYDCVHV